MRSSIELPKLFNSLRLRVLLGCLLLMSFSALASTFFIRQLLYDRLEERIAKDLHRIVGEFDRHATITTQTEAAKVGSPNLQDLFASFIKREVTYDKYYLLLADDRVYQTSDRQLTSGFHFTRDKLAQLSKISQPEAGEIELSPTSEIYYQAKPIDFNSNERSVFVAIFDATGECREIDAAMKVVIQVNLGVFVISAIAALLDTQRILRPLDLLNNTARRITDSDLSERIKVRGRNEIAELTLTFNEMLDRLQASIHSQKEFFNYAGHELRTPLSIIRVNLEMLSDDPQERKATIAIVTDELDRINRYVNDMILLAKSEQPDFLLLETVELRDFTKEIYTKAVALGDRDWELNEIGTGTISCDRHRLTQVLMNLVQNAVQQTHVGDRISIGSQLKNGMARFWVRDTGPGIDPCVQQMIFERFIRCPDARQRFEGMGLGLAIVKAIVEAHGGKIELESELNHGSTFTAIVPIDPP